MSHKFKIGDKVRHTQGDYTFGHKVGEVVSVDPLLIGGLYEEGVNWEVIESKYPEWELVEPAPEQEGFKMSDLFKEGDRGVTVDFGKHHKITTTYEPYTASEKPLVKVNDDGTYYLEFDGTEPYQNDLGPKEEEDRVHKFKVGDWVVPMEPEIIFLKFKGKIGKVVEAEDYYWNEPIYKICFGDCVQTGYEDTDKLMSIKESMNEALEFYSYEIGDIRIRMKEEYCRDDPITLDDDDFKIASDGGPTKYYDFPEGWNTWNDLADYKAKNQWKEHSFHLGNIGKAIYRWGEKDGATKTYDARKIVYSGLRVLLMMEGKEHLRKYLEDLLSDPQFKE